MFIVWHVRLLFANLVTIIDTQVRSVLFSLDEDSSFTIGIAISLVLVACVAVLIIIILVMVIRRKRIKKSARRHDSYNEYTEPPSIIRWFICMHYITKNVNSMFIIHLSLVFFRVRY